MLLNYHWTMFYANKLRSDDGLKMFDIRAKQRREGEKLYKMEQWVL